MVHWHKCPWARHQRGQPVTLTLLSRLWQTYPDLCFFSFLPLFHNGAQQKPYHVALFPKHSQCHPLEAWCVRLWHLAPLQLPSLTKLSRGLCSLFLLLVLQPLKSATFSGKHSHPSPITVPSVPPAQSSQAMNLLSSCPTLCPLL